MTSNSKIPGLTVLLSLAVAFALSAAAKPAEAAAPPELDNVLRKLDASAAKFKSAEAEVLVEITETQPIQETSTQTGNMLLQRKGGQLSMAMHLKTYNGKPALKDVTYVDGDFRLYDPAQKQVQVFKAGNRSDIDTFLAVGFGGSGKDLEKNWAISYAGTEQVGGTTAAKLEMTPRQDSVKENIVKVILWIDLDKGLAVKQQSFDPSGNYRSVTYKNLKLNASLPPNPFEIKTAAGTKVISR